MAGRLIWDEEDAGSIPAVSTRIVWTLLIWEEGRS